jgi:glycerate dehydrogenase
MHRIVFLDRASLGATLRTPSFAHTWHDHERTLPHELRERLVDATIVVTNKVALSAEVLDAASSLQMVAVAATGTDIVDIAACRQRSLVVSNIRNYATASLPEHVFALMLALRRNLLAYRDDVEQGLWQRAPQFCLLTHPIHDLADSTLGVIGLGVLGQSVAKLGLAFGMRVLGFDPDAQPRDGIVRASIEQILQQADVVTLHAPLTAETRHMIGAAELMRMKRSALLINTSRGGLVDEAALAQALLAGDIGGAGFDVLTSEPPRDDNPLLALRLPNFILTPHVAWASAEAMQALADQLVDNIEAFVAGSPRNVVS